MGVFADDLEEALDGLDLRDGGIPMPLQVRALPEDSPNGSGPNIGCLGNGNLVLGSGFAKSGTNFEDHDAVSGDTKTKIEFLPYGGRWTPHVQERFYEALTSRMFELAECQPGLPNDWPLYCGPRPFRIRQPALFPNGEKSGRRAADFQRSDNLSVGRHVPAAC